MFTQATIPPDVTQATAAASGESHTCALEPYGTARCWGRGDFGQTTVPPELNYAVAIAAGSQSSCAVSEDGQLRCWGDREEIPEDAIDAVDVVGGQDHTCALSRTGRVICWGGNDYQQTSVPANLQGVLKVVAGRYHTCAVRGDQKVVCWGAGTSEVYCDPTNDIQDCGQSLVPEDLGTVRDLSAGMYHTCAVNTDNNVVCWGMGTGTQGCGDYNSPNTEWNCGQSIVPTNLPPASGVTTGEVHTCALVGGGNVRCWGSGTTVGNCNGSEWDCGQSIVPDDLELPVRQVSAGYHHTCAIQNDNQIRCWGHNQYGQLDVPLGLGRPTSLSAGYTHTCMVAINGTTHCWGGGDEAHIGDNAYVHAFSQSVIPEELNQAVKVGVGERHSCAVSPRGAVICWGLGSSTDHGMGTGRDQATVPEGWPMRVGYDNAPFGHIRTGTYTFEPACSDDEVFSLHWNGSTSAHTLPDFGCILPVCGDHVIEGTEICDDGNTSDGDLCAADCSALTPICGDGIKLGNEVCDDGNTSDGDWCSADCSQAVAICGDGHLSPGEVCDDGDTDDANACSNSCTPNVSECPAPSFISDGYCDGMTNIAACNWDGGDCCESACIDAAYTCGSVSFDCQNPAACENSGGC